MASRTVLDEKIQFINEDDLEYVASKIITGMEKSDDNSDDVIIIDDNLDLIRKIREEFGDSPENILPFIESCKRNSDSINHCKDLLRVS